MSWRGSQHMSQNFVDNHNTTNSSQIQNTSSQYRRGKLNLGKHVASLNELIGSNFHSIQQSNTIHSQNSGNMNPKLNAFSCETQPETPTPHLSSQLSKPSMVGNVRQQRSSVKSSDSLVQRVDKQKLFGKLENLEKKMESLEKLQQTQFVTIQDFLSEIKSKMQQFEMDLQTSQRQLESHHRLYIHI